MAEEKKKSNLKFIIISIVGLLVIGVAVFFGVYYTMSKNAEPKEVVVVEGYAELGEILVNLNESGSKKYVQMVATLTYDNANEELAEEITTKNVVLKDAAIFYLKSLTVDDFSASNELTLKKSLVDKFNSSLSSGTIIDIKFNELLVQ